MITIAVTGSLSSGKTEVTKILKSMGAKVFDADVSAHNAVEIGKPAYRAVVKIFGKEFLLPNKQINRKKLAERVFANPRDLKKLNILLHPGVIFESLQQIEKNKNKKGVLVLDVPLLYESKMGSLTDFVIVVSAKRENIMRRSVKKGLSKTLVNKILSTQWSLEKKAKLADFVIENNGTLAQLKKEVAKVLKEIKGSWDEKTAPYYNVKSEFVING